MCVGKTLNMDSCFKFLGNLEGIWGNPGEITHIGWKIPGVYRVKFNMFYQKKGFQSYKTSKSAITFDRGACSTHCLQY